MPLDARMVGAATEVLQHDIDARWVMAYAAGLGDLNPRYLDTAAHTVVAHPVFPVCIEWPVILTSRTLPGYENTTLEEARRGVHAAHDLHIHRPIQDGDVLSTQATVIGLEATKAGARQTTRLDTKDAAGNLVCQTFQVGINRGVEVTGNPIVPDAPLPPKLATQPEAPQAEWDVAIATEAAHVYTECARIFNPIHTDRAVALAAGLPDIILHGTATLAYAVTQLIDRCLDGDPTQVKRLGGRFSAMVLMPSTIKIRLLGREQDTLFFDVINAEGEVAFSNGFLCV